MQAAREHVVGMMIIGLICLLAGFTALFSGNVAIGLCLLVMVFAGWIKAGCSDS
jgi:hypothetical protein